MVVPWIAHARRARPSGFWRLKVCLLLCALTFAMSGAAVMDASGKVLATRNILTVSFFLGTVLLPAAAIPGVRVHLQGGGVPAPAPG